MIDPTRLSPTVVKAQRKVRPFHAAFRDTDGNLLISRVGWKTQLAARYRAHLILRRWARLYVWVRLFGRRNDA